MIYVHRTPPGRRNYPRPASHAEAQDHISQRPTRNRTNGSDSQCLQHPAVSRPPVPPALFPATDANRYTYPGWWRVATIHRNACNGESKTLIFDFRIRTWSMVVLTLIAHSTTVIGFSSIRVLCEQSSRVTL